MDIVEELQKLIDQHAGCEPDDCDLREDLIHLLERIRETEG